MRQGKGMQRSEIVVERSFDHTVVHVRHPDTACKKDYSLRLIDDSGVARIVFSACGMRFHGEDDFLSTSEHVSAIELQSVLAFIRQRWSEIKPEGPVLQTAIHYREGEEKN